VQNVAAFCESQRADRLSINGYIVAGLSGRKEAISGRIPRIGGSIGAQADNRL
jgi:hypothetical protein